MREKIKAFIAVAFFIIVIAVNVSVEYNRDGLANEHPAYFFDAVYADNSNPSPLSFETGLFIFDHNDECAMQIKIDGYKNLKTPYLLKKGDFVCCGERITDGKTVLLRITDNRVIWSMDIDVIPEHLIVTENLDVFFTAQGMLYRAVISKNYVETLCADLGKEMNMNRIYTDGAKILYAKENGFNSFRWFLYDSRTDEERFIIEADRCVGFASDGDIIVTYPHYELKPANSYKMKKVNIKTLEVERFMPFMRVNDPVILNDEYIIDFRCESKYNTLYPFVYLVSIKKSVSISIDGIRAMADRQYILINDIFIWR